ncbi:MAG TPA: glycosyltransferase family 39 protein [Acidimicrobiia bacterium]|nr:glycosyltransferase family 39 protein [Acidimicrobiia bacterium]
MLTALLLNTWRLSANGLGNTYYAAAVRSMGQSWRNFFFGAFDPGGFITVDKPPLALWFQTASTRLFGFSSWSLLLPGALAGAAAVALLWVIVSRRYGTVAATVAASALALSPVNVAVNRMNLPDPFMVLFLVASAWALLRSFDAPRWGRWLVLSGLFFGAAFDAKMLAAAIPAPAFGLAVLLGSPGRWPHRFRRAAVLAAAALAFTLPWMTIVDLTPASARPYVGGSSNNTERNLIIGYNGVGRVDGQGESRGARRADPGRAVPEDVPGRDAAQRLRGAGGFGGFGGFFGDRPGTFRLFSASDGPQIAWLFPLGLLAVLAALWHHRRSRAALGGIALWTGWVVLHWAVFSYAKGIFHSYYTSALAPGLAALVGIGAAAVLAEARRDRAWLAYAAGGVVGSAGLALSLSRRAGPVLGWIRPTVIGLTAVAVIGLAAAAAARRGRRFVAAPLAAGMVAALLAPAAWAVTETTNRSLDAAGPQGGPRAGAAGRFSGAPGSAAGRAGTDAPARQDPSAAEAGLARFLTAHDTGQRWDLAVTSAMSAADLVARENLSVMALGGFSGSDPAATVSSVAGMVEKGEVRYFLTGNGFGRGRPGRTDAAPQEASGDFGGFGGFGGFGRGGTAGQIMQAVQAVCTPVAAGAADGTAPLPSSYAGQLYDCAGRGPALAAHG